MFHPDVYLPKTDFEREQFKKGKDEGKDEGKAEGIAESLLMILAARMIEITESEKHRILTETSPTTLRRWLDRAITARSTADVF